MANIKPNTFTTYELTPEEDITGSILSELQQYKLQNERAAVADSLVRLTFDPSNVSKYLQEEAELQGKLNMLDYIFALHEYAVQQLNERK